MFIRSERLFLRPGWPEDREELLALIGDEAVVRNLATSSWPSTADDVQEFICRPRDKLLPHFFVTLPTADGAKLIGSIGFGRDGEDAELGYWIARSHWGQGYATEAARAVLCLARALGHRRVVASHFIDNRAARRVLAKAGFRPTGIVRPRYSLARGGDAPAMIYVAELDAVGGGDEGADMRAA